MASDDKQQAGYCSESLPPKLTSTVRDKVLAVFLALENMAGMSSA